MIDALPLLLAPEGYQISRSVRLRSSATAYLNRTFGTPTNNRLYFLSTWVKRGTLGVRQELFDFYSTSEANNYFFFTATDTLGYTFDNGVVYSLGTTAVFRDPSSWYHVCLLIDTAQATAANRVKIYVNGVQQTLTGTYLPQNTLTYINGSGRNITIGRRGAAADFYFDGYLTEINFIDGQALDPSSFGETDLITGVWNPKKYTGTYGANGFYLNFSDNSAATAAAIGKDSSGNGNNWTPTGISVTAGATYDSMLDVPTMWADGGNGRGNYCTVNPLKNDSTITLTDGNLTLQLANESGGRSSAGTIAMSSGKFYWEATVTANGGNRAGVGIATDSTSTADYSGSYATGYMYGGVDGSKYNNGTATSYGSTYTTNDVIGVALDLDSGTLTFYKNGTSQGTAFSSLSGTFVPRFDNSGNVTSTSVTYAVNFGQRPFSYTPPTGFKALNTQNLPDSTILNGTQYFAVVNRTGFGASGGSITSLKFQPDFSWSKSRNIVANHNIVDSGRGITKLLSIDTTTAEATVSTYITAFNANGYTLGTGDYATTTTAVDWLWKKGPTQGFDIVTYTGTGANLTIAHSLGVAPKMMILKQRTAASTTNWAVWHSALANTEYILLNGTAAKATGATYWNSTLPSSSVFSLGTAADVNTNSGTYVAYLFAEVAGFSKFGSYTGNGNADGPFVNCGFRPRWIMIKNITAAATEWAMYDSARDTYNLTTQRIDANSSNAELTATTGLDFVANGFKIRATNSTHNTSGASYIYAAFAENPFKYSLAR